MASRFAKRYIGCYSSPNSNTMSSKSKSKKNALTQLESPKDNESLKLSRRSFMKASAAGAAVVGVGLSLKPKLATTTNAPLFNNNPDPFAPITINLNVNGNCTLLQWNSVQCWSMS